MDRAPYYKRIYTMLGQLDARDHKEDLLEPYGVARLRDLSDRALLQVHELLRFRVQESLRHHRSAVLAKLTAMGLSQQAGEPAAGYFARVDAYVSQPRIAGKRFRELSIGELQALRRKLCAVHNRSGFIAGPVPLPPRITSVKPS
jgi:hypothetical protein